MVKNIREVIKEEVLSITPCDDLETNHINDVISWIESGQEIFRIAKPATPPKHLVSYFVLVDKVNKSILLVDHIKAQLWLPPGGHVELNEDPIDTVSREIQEELFTEAQFLNQNTMPFFITVTETVGLTAGHTDVSLWFLLEGKSNVVLKYDSREFNGVKWFTYNEILGLPIEKFDPHLHRLVNKLSNTLY